MGSMTELRLFDTRDKDSTAMRPRNPTLLPLDTAVPIEIQMLKEWLTESVKHGGLNRHEVQVP